MSNKLLMHYGCQMATGRFMWVSLSLLFLELGVSFQPLQESYEQYGPLVTHSWFKMLWEKLSRFGITVTVADLSTEYPWDGDQFIMQVLLKQGYPMDILLRLNHVRVSLQLLFMSDILTASGHKVNPEVLLRRAPGDAWSSMRWPTEHPTDSDFLLWRNALLSICPSRSRSTQLGRFTASTHRIWRWMLSKGEGSLHHLKDNGITEEVFVAGKKPNCFNYSHSQLRSHHNIVCLVEPTLGNGSWRLTLLAP
jgi:hypothetical protein